MLWWGFKTRKQNRICHQHWYPWSSTEDVFNTKTSPDKKIINSSLGFLFGVFIALLSIVKSWKHVFEVRMETIIFNYKILYVIKVNKLEKQERKQEKNIVSQIRQRLLFLEAKNCKVPFWTCLETQRKRPDRESKIESARLVVSKGGYFLTKNERKKRRKVCSSDQTKRR